MNLLNRFEDEFNIKLTKQQMEAVLHVDGPALVLAVPGAGKTTTLISRLAYMIIDKKIKPENILSITFSKASAMDMKKRFQHFFGKEIREEIHFSTIHSLSYGILREFYNGKNVKFTFIEDEKAVITKRTLLKKINYEINKTYINDEKYEELSSAIGYVKNKLIAAKELKSDIKGFTLIYNEFEKIKRENNYLDFDDMLTKAYEILREDKTLLDKYRKRFPYSMIDECQDTSLVQYKIVQLIAAPLNNLFCVADDDQSIYGFRGASPKELLEFEKVYPNAKIFYMEENFRSTKTIVNMANVFIKNNKNRFNKELCTNNVQGEMLKVKKVQDDIDQIDFVIKEIKNSNSGSTFAVLYRTNISTITLADALYRNGIPFYVREHKNNFFAHWVLQDIKAFLNLAYNRTDIEAFKKIYYKMNSYLPKKSIEFLENQNINKSVFNTLIERFSDFDNNMIKRLKNFEIEFDTLSRLSPFMAIEHIETELSYISYIEDKAEDMGYSKTTLINILSKLKYIAGNTKTINEFFNRLDELKVILEKSKFNRDEAKVILSTIHSVKGLEFDEVCIIDLIDEQFPGASAIEDLNQNKSELMEEERRLMYVAVTRAKKNLTIMGIENKKDTNISISRFVSEIENIILPKVAKESIKVNLNNNYDEIYKKNAIVSHIVYGQGKVISLEKEYIGIDFVKVGKKVLSVALCKSKELLY